MLISYPGKFYSFVSKYYKFIVYPLVVFIFILAVFLFLNYQEKPVYFEKKPPVVYSEEEIEKTLADITNKGYTLDIGPYFEEVRSRLLARQLGIMKYKLKANDNLWDIAKHFRIRIDTVVGANSYLKSLTRTKQGQELLILSKKGVLHKVKEKEDLQAITGLYGVSKEKLEAENELAGGIKAGDYLFIPDVPPLEMTEEMKSQYDLTKLFGSPIWSGARTYTSYMKIRSDPFTGAKSFHDGLDIKAFPEDKICAVASGTVLFSGENGGFGLMIKIKHDNGYTTLYGHNSKLYVVSGQKVKKGQIIARAGSTGRSTGIHLHFTVWDKDNKLVDPSLMLMTTK